MNFSDKLFGDPFDSPCHQEVKRKEKYLTNHGEFGLQMKQFSGPEGSLMFPLETTGWH